MWFDSSFINEYKDFLKLLSKEEISNYFQKYRQGDLEAKKQIINHNINFVIYYVYKKFSKTPYEMEELISVALIGLMKGVEKFDINRGTEFLTYASRCIDNEILMFLRKEKKHLLVESLQKPIKNYADGFEIRVENLLKDNDLDFTIALEKEFIYKEIREIVNNLPNRDREIIMLHFGFFDNKVYTQQEIANKLGVSQSYISKLIKKILRELKIQLENKEIIEKCVTRKANEFNK